MRACVNVKTPGWLSSRLLAAFALIALCGWAALAAASGFKVSSVQARANGQSLRLTGSIDLSLSGKVEDAIANGIPIELLIDVRLYRDRRFLWDENVESWTLRRELRHHALTGQYLINAGPGAAVARETFNTLNEALNEMGSLSDLNLPISGVLAADAEYHVKLRAGLDVEALPPLLRPVAYTARAWNLSSGWTTWKVQR